MHNVRTDQPTYGDFTSSRDLHDCILRVQEAQDEFMLLDAHIRARFDNDPGKLLDFVSNPDNRAEAIELGLMKAPADAPQASQVPQGEEAPPA
jgi:phage internal scaffolding protein